VAVIIMLASFSATAALAQDRAADLKVAEIVPAEASHALVIDRLRPTIVTASLGGSLSVTALDANQQQAAAEPAQPKLTPQLLAAYVARQQQLRAFNHFDVNPPPALTPELLSGYIERQRNPALDAIDAATPAGATASADDDKALNAKMLEAYATQKFVPTTKRIKLAAGERLCLTQAIYYEARGESVEGQWAVANVIINRAFSGKFPSTICGVVFQNASKGYHQCQFTFACDGKTDVGTERQAWNRAEDIADRAFAEFQQGDRPHVLPKSALYYHTRSVAPQWSYTYQRVASIGAHIFYSP
jgi:spore germination cell wall hydrolase CwlJ-like protein